MNNLELQSMINDYLNLEIDTLKKLNVSNIIQVLSIILNTVENNGYIYIFGNGGSALTASHFACDLNKGLFYKTGKNFNAVCLSDNVGILTAISNDVAYDHVYSEQLKRVLKENDLVIAISGSGNSKNIIEAVNYSKQLNVPVIGITGYDGGKLKELSDYHLDVNVNNMQISEDIHLTFNHLIHYILSNIIV